jgi:hypothetical protein
MHKSITKINKAAIIIIYHHGTNFCNFSNDINKVVPLLMAKQTEIQTENKQTHLLKFN